MIAQLLSASDGLYGGTPIDAVPTWIANLWRIALWIGMVYYVILLLSRFGPGQHMRRAETGVVFWARISLIIVFTRSAWAMANNWDAPLTWDGMPVTTIILACAYMAAFRYNHPGGADPRLDRRDRRAPVAPPGRIGAVRRGSS